MSSTRIRISSAIAFCALATGACSGEAKNPGNLDVVRVARSTLLTNAPLVIGDEEGFFAREGIRIEYVAIPGVTVQSLPALQQGDIDVLSAAISIGIINGVGGGATFRIVADRGHIDPDACEPFGIIGRKALFEGKEINAALLRGRRVSTNDVGPSGYVFSKYLEKFGLTLKDVRVVRLPPSVEPQAMDVGNVDIVTRGDPHFYSMIARGHRLLAGAKDVTPGSHLSVLVYGPTFLRDKPGLGLRFMKAYLAAVRQYNEGPTARNVDIVSRRLGLESDALKKMCWPSTKEDGSVNPQTLVDYQEWAMKNGNLEKVIDPAQLIDPTFASRAYEELKRN